MREPEARDPVRAAAKEQPDAVALIGPARSWTYRQLDETVDALGNRLAAHCTPPNAVIACLLPPGPEVVAAVHAVPRAGATLLPLHHAWTPGEILRCLETVQPQAIVALEQTADAAREVAGGTPVVRFTWNAPVAGPSSREPPEDCAILWTSGTRDRPHGVRVSHTNLVHSARATRERLSLSPSDTWYAALAVAHVGGLALVHRAAYCRSAVLAAGAYAADDLSAAIDAGAVTHASLVPIMLRRLLDERTTSRPPPSLRALLIGGAPVGEALLREVLDLDYPIALTYGLTEAGSQVATAPPDLVRAKPGTVGAPLEGMRVRIGDAGEILVAGPTVASGYVGGAQRPTESDWLRTGDRGRLDGDGHLWVEGRLIDRILSGGVTVDPGEIEAVLARHPAVADVAVVGLADPEWGEIVAAVVVLRPGSAVSHDALAAHCRPVLSAAKRPRRFAFLTELPRNPNGKTDTCALIRSLEGTG